MASSPADTSTVLNPGVGGDAMGESLISQPSTASPNPGPTLVKHARVVRTDDDGRILGMPMSDDTGQAILVMLSKINDKLALMAGTLS
jgi:hypothetical protein